MVRKASLRDHKIKPENSGRKERKNMYYLKLAGTALLTTLLLTACAAEKEPEGVVPQSYKDAMGKADSVEEALQGAAELRMEEVDEGSK